MLVSNEQNRVRYKFNKLTAKEKKNYINNLVVLEQKLNGLGYDMFLSYGGLLSGIRNKDLISYDKDIDVAIVAKSGNNDYKSLKNEIDGVYKKMPNHRMILNPRPTSLWGHLRFTVFMSTPPERFKNMFYDVYLSFEDPNNSEHQCIYNFFPRMHVINGKSTERYYSSIPKDWIFPLKREGVIGGHKFLVPNKYKLCLETWYEDWKVPSDVYYTVHRLKFIKMNECKRVEKIKRRLHG